jgi:hypothetical protein
MKDRLSAAVQKPMHREHLRTASLVMLLESLTELGITRSVLALVVAIAVFAWDLVFILCDAEQEGSI